MNKIFLISFLILISAFSIIAQTPCPTISIDAPTGLVKRGGTMTFTAKVEGISTENLKYKWTISAGEISSGQETLTINVATTEDRAGQTITAIFEVSGLPENCSKEFSGAGEIEPPQMPSCGVPKVEEYGKISWKNEKIKLDEIANVIKRNEETTLFFRINLPAKNSSQIFKAKVRQIVKYLTEEHKIPKDKLRFVLDENDANLTEVYLVPFGVALPL